MYSTKPKLLTACLIFMALAGRSQEIINAYAEVTAISDTVLTIGSYHILNDQFEVGEQVILMQMQGDVSIDQTNTSNFGGITDIGSAGLYEALTIQSITSGGSSTLTKDLWVENFEDLATGNTEDTGETSWNVSNTANTQVRNDPSINGNSLSTTRVGNQRSSVWTSETIDISGYTDVYITASISAIFNNAGGDQLTINYSIDGNTEQTFGDLAGTGEQANNSQTVTATGLNGSTLQIIARFYCSLANEYAMIDDISVQYDYEAPIPSSISLSSNWVNTYEIGANSSVQLISFPKMTNYTSTSDLTALDWDGAIGGVFALDVVNTLTLEHNIDVSGTGFRGGDTNPTANPNECWEADDYVVYHTNNDSYGYKGEGIYKNTDANYTYAMGKIANGAGGGSYHNAGGGGGGNFTTGGDGGPGWKYNETEGCDPSAGGYGGADLSDYIAANKIYMGGGGGGGNQNNGGGTSGGDGGGIIIIRATTVETNGSCASLNISSDGESIVDAQNDGGGGAGAGGSILFQVSNWNLDCDINVSATGGDGSDSNSNETHAGGGGGGKGVIIFNGTMPASDYSASNGQGAGGDNNTGGSSTADSGDTNPSNPDADPDGIVENDEGPLPVELTYWKASRNGSQINLNWATAIEIDNDYFTVEKSYNGDRWEIVGRISGQGTSSDPHEYQLQDYADHQQIVYYRLIQTDFDGKYEQFAVLVLQPEIDLSNLILYPNPTNGLFSIQLPGSYYAQEIEAQLYDQHGKVISADFQNKNGNLKFDFSNLPSGMYVLHLQIGDASHAANVRIK